MFRRVFLGDSITYGGGDVPDRSLFVNGIVAALGTIAGSRIEAVNLAAPGWGIQNMAGYVEAMGTLDVDLLPWVVSDADLRRPKTMAAENGFPTDEGSDDENSDAILAENVRAVLHDTPELPTAAAHAAPSLVSEPRALPQRRQAIQ